MNKNHARLTLVLSILLLTAVGFDFAALTSRTKQENQIPQKPKPTISEAVKEIGQVLGGCSPCFEFYLRDSSDNSYISAAIATLETRDPFDSPTWTFSEISKGGPESIYNLDIGAAGGSLKAGYTLPSTVQVEIEKDGYIAKTVSITSDISAPDTVYLSKVLPQAPSQEVSPTKSVSKTTNKKTVTQPSIKDDSLPNEFKGEGTESTDLSKIDNPTSVANFTLETTKNKIVFNLPVDLSSADTVSKFKNLNNFVVANISGVVSIDSSNLPVLNKPATITMKNLPFVKTPRVLVNGKVDSSVVSNIYYSGGTLTFNAAHFSTFTAEPTIGITDPANGTETTQKTVDLKGSVSDPTASVSAKINNKDLGKLKIATDSGKFTSSVELSEGLNKIVVTAIATSGAVATASVSATLLKVASNYTSFFVLSAFLAIIALAAAIWALKKLRKPGKSEVEKQV